MRRTLSNSKWRVVMLNRMANETDVTTRITNSSAVDNPCWVIVKLSPNILSVARAVPGENALNNDGMTIKIENMGMNIQVRFRKYPNRTCDK